MLLVKNNDQTKMEEGDYFAIETFGSTGRGKVIESVSLRYHTAMNTAIERPLTGRVLALREDHRCAERTYTVNPVPFQTAMPNYRFDCW